MISGVNLSNFAVDSSGRVTLAGASSGIDFQSAIDAIIAARRIPVDRLETRVTENTDRITAFSDFTALVNVLRDSLDALRGKPTFDGSGDIFKAKQVFASTSRTDAVAPAAAANLVGVSVTNAADLGSHTLEILQVAQANKLTSDAATGTTIDLGSAFGGAANSIEGSFEINGRRIDVLSSDTLITLSDRINTANTGSTASGVTASIISSGTFQNFLAFTADKTGAPIKLRTSHRIGSDTATSTTSDLQTALGLGTPVEGNFEINGTLITVSSTDTLQSLVTAINGAAAGVTASIVTNGANSTLAITTDDATKTISLTNATHQSDAVASATAALTTFGVTGGASSFVVRDATGASLGTVNYDATTDTLNTLQASVTALAGVTATVVNVGANFALQVTADNGQSLTIDTDTGDLVSTLKLNKDVMSQLGLSTNRGDTFKNELSVTNNILEKLGVANSDAYRNGLASSKVGASAGLDKIVFDGTQPEAPYRITFAQATQTLTVTLADGTGTTSDSFVLTQANGVAETARFTVGGIGITLDVGTTFNKTADITLAANAASVTGTGAIDGATVEITGSTGDISGLASSTLTLGSLATPSSITVTSGNFTGTFDATTTGTKTVTLKDGNGNSLSIQFNVLTAFDGAESAGSITLNSLENTVAAPDGMVLLNELVTARKANFKADSLLDLSAFQGSAQASTTAGLGITGTLRIATPNAGNVDIAIAATDTLNVIRDKINANTSLKAAAIGASVITDSSGKFHLEVRRSDLTVVDNAKVLDQKPAATSTALGLTDALAFKRDDGTTIATVAIAGTDSLDSIVANINGDTALQNAGISASAVATGASFRLQINYDTSLTVTSPDAADTALGLARPDLIIERDDNNVTDLFDGMTITLFQAEAGTTIKLDVDRNLTGVKQGVLDLVTAYNDVKSFINQQELANSSTGTAADTAGPLFGNSTLGSIETSLASILGQGAAGLSTGSLFQVLAQIGVDFVDNSTVSDVLLEDTLVVDETVLDAALLSNPEDVRRLFAFDFSASDPRVGLIGFTGQTQGTAGGYTLDITHDGTNITAATIDGVPGSVTINGNILTATDQTGANGLQLIYNGNTSVTGINLDISTGIGSQMFFEVDRIVDQTTGSIQAEVDSLTDQNTLAQSRIDEILARLERQRQSLLDRFIRMEQTLTTINNTLNAIKQQFDALSQSGSG